MRFILLTTLYNEIREHRINEYLYCIKKNLNNEYIDKIIIFFEKNDDKYNEILTKLEALISDNIIIEYINHRPTFNDFFQYANTKLLNNNIIITNADIYYDENKGLNLLTNIDLTDKFIVLTRYNKIAYPGYHQQQTGYIIETKEGKLKSQFKTGCSIDSWIFKTPLKIDFRCHYRLGIVQCDSSLNYQLIKSNNYKVYNPCLDIISIHEHKNWSPSNYNLVEDDITKKKISRKKWMEMCKKRGDFFASIKFCRIKYVLEN